MPRAKIIFSCLGHLYVHLFMAFYFVIVLALEADWSLPYHELIGLWTLASLLLGVAALPAGMLADRIGATRMMVVFFIGMGASSVAAGASRSPDTLLVSLAGIGLFGAIYHPVGIAWLVRASSRNRGKVLGFNGIFGSLGTAVAGISAGLLIDLGSWRAAFVVPGLIAVATGLVLLVLHLRGAVVDAPRTPARSWTPASLDTRRAVMILVVTMFLAGLIYHATQISLPKLFEQRHHGLAGHGAFGVGLLLAGVYTAAGFMQLLGGHLADRYPLKPVYVGAFVLQVPLLWMAGSLGGLPLMLAATFMVMAGVGALPAENMLLARSTPEHRHGLVFGIKFVLAFTAGPIAVQLVAVVTAVTGGFYWVYVALSALALGAMLAALALPSPEHS